MISVLLFEFDKIFTLLPQLPINNIQDICFRPLPAIKWHSKAYEVWQEMKKQNIPVILVSYDDEMFIKEAVYSAGLCTCFDRFIFVNELISEGEQPYEVIMKELGRVYGLCKPYSYHDLAPSIASPFASSPLFTSPSVSAMLKHSFR